MRYAQSSFIPIALCFLMALALQSSDALAQKKMSPEEEAIYRNMMKSTGIDPGLAMEAKKQNESSRQWTEGSGIVDYHIVGVYQGQPLITSDPGKGSGRADVTDRVVIDLKRLIPWLKSRRFVPAAASPYLPAARRDPKSWSYRRL